MATLRKDELYIEMPSAWPNKRPNFEAAERYVRMTAPKDSKGNTIHGCAVAMFPPEDAKGGILLPDTVRKQLRPEAGWIVAATPGFELTVGLKVLVRPYRGLWFEGDFEAGDFKWHEVRFFRYWEANIPMCWTYSDVECIYEEWMPTGNWVLVDRDMTDTMNSGILLSEHAARPLRQRATVIKVGPKVKDLKFGDEVLVDTHPNVPITPRWAGMPPTFQLMREVDHAGVRQIYARVT